MPNWQTWDRTHYKWSNTDIKDGKDVMSARPPQYKTSRLERAAFRYVFADTYNGDLSIMELLGCCVCIGTFFINGFSIISVWLRLLMTGTVTSDGTDPHYPALVSITVNFEFGFFMINFLVALWKWRGMGKTVIPLGDGETKNVWNRFAKYRFVAAQCIELGELNAFTLLRLIKPYYLKYHMRKAREISAYARGILGPIIFVLYMFVTLILAVCAFVFILAKVALLQFIFKRKPWLLPTQGGGWSIDDWIQFVGFVNNLARRDQSESSRVKVLEYAIVGHFISVDGQQADAAEQLVCDFYEEVMGEIVKAGTVDGKLRMKTRLELFAFFANLEAGALFKFHEIAYGMGTVSIDGRRQLDGLLCYSDSKERATGRVVSASANEPTATPTSQHSDADEDVCVDMPPISQAWTHVANEADEGMILPPEETGCQVDEEDLDLARRVAGVIDPDRTPPIEGIPTGASMKAVGTVVRKIEDILCCMICISEKQAQRNKKQRARRGASSVGDGLSMGASQFGSPYSRASLSPSRRAGGSDGPASARRGSAGGSDGKVSSRHSKNENRLLELPLPEDAKKHAREIRRPRGGIPGSVLQEVHDVPKDLMVIRVVGAKGLKGEESGCGPCAGIDCDAFVEVSIPNLATVHQPVKGSWTNNVGSTHVAPPGDTDPSFGEAFNFPKSKKPTTVLLEVFDYDVGSSNDSLGFGNLHLSKELLFRGGWSEHWVDLLERPDAEADGDFGSPMGRQIEAEGGLTRAALMPAPGQVLIELGLAERRQLQDRRRSKQPKKGRQAPPPTPAPPEEEDMFAGEARSQVQSDIDDPPDHDVGAGEFTAAYSREEADGEYATTENEDVRQFEECEESSASHDESLPMDGVESAETPTPIARLNGVFDGGGAAPLAPESRRSMEPKTDVSRDVGNETTYEATTVADEASEDATPSSAASAAAESEATTISHPNPAAAPRLPRRGN